MPGDLPARQRLLLSAATVSGGFVVMVLRRPGALVSPTIWGEDGTIFWAQALSPGHDLVTPYAAQSWAVQRLLTAALTGLPVSIMPVAIYTAACGVAVLSLAVVLQARAGTVLGPFPRRVLAFGLLVMVPTATEIQGNLANLHVWIGSSLLVVLVLAPPVTLWGRCVELAWVALASVTGLLGVILLPVAIWALWRMRTGYVWLRSSLVAMGATVNVIVWATQDRRPSEDLVQQLMLVPAALLKRVGGGLTVGHHLMEVFWPHGLLNILLLPSILMVGLLGYLAWVDRKGPSAIWLGAAGVWLVLGVVSPTGVSTADWVLDPSAYWRYFGMALAAGLLVLVRGMGGTVGTRSVAMLGLLACSFSLVADAYIKVASPAVGRDDLRAFEVCLDGRSPPPCYLPIAPDGWTVVVD